MIRMIIAVDRGNAIGWRDGRLPWRIPHDLKRFKELTSGHTVIMGKNTFHSLGRPAGLPNRMNVLLTSMPASVAAEKYPEVNTISDLDWVRATNAYQPDRQLWLIGGASVYDQALDAHMVDEIYLTLVHDTSGADVTLKYDLSAWKLFVLNEFKEGRLWIVTQYEMIPVTENAPATTYITLKKVSK